MTLMQSLHMFRNKQLCQKIPSGEKTKKPVQNSMKIILWHCKFKNRNSNPISQKSAHTRYLLIQEKLLFTLIFVTPLPPFLPPSHQPPLKKCFRNHFFRKSNKNISFVYINFHELMKNMHLVDMQFCKYLKNFLNLLQFLHEKISPFNSRQI